MNQAPLPSQENGHRYVNDTYGIAFHYPSGYVLEEGEKGDRAERHYAIVLTRQEDASPRENGEGPPTISIDIYQDHPDHQTLSEWLKDNNTSNFKLSDGTYVFTEINGTEAASYRWSGLYEGETTALLHKGNVVAFTVTYLTPEDAHLNVYRELQSSVELK